MSVTETLRIFFVDNRLIFRNLRDFAEPGSVGQELACCYSDRQMRKPDIARQLARRARVSQGEAADRLDVILQKIVSDLRKGMESPLPGLGKFKHGPDGQVAFEAEARKRHD